MQRKAAIVGVGALSLLVVALVSNDLYISKLAAGLALFGGHFFLKTLSENTEDEKFQTH